MVINNKVQLIGGLLLLLSFILSFFTFSAGWLLYPCFGLLLGSLGIDLYLVITKQQTISSWFRNKLPKWVDFILTIGLCVLVSYIFCAIAGLQIGLIVGLFYLHGTLNGHLNGTF